MELTAEQIILVGLVATALSTVLRLVGAWFGVELGKAAMTGVVSVVSVGLSLAFQLPELPVYQDPFQYALEWLPILTAQVGFAKIIYNVLLARLLDASGITVENVLKLKEGK